MPVLKFKPHKYNRLIANGTKYFIKELDSGFLWVVPSKCPHRGGPLHLGKQCKVTGASICPWHDNRVGLHCVKKQALSLVKSGDDISIVLPDGVYHSWNEAPIEGLKHA
ncbi:Rieske 2Fe-2S domain-containing protein [Aliivibrio fischeri]|uniref:Rieske 2Fe-2S domain-containing protein n=1 Tax=Aliivibrio fischeri TaxID=668 RepID=UPI00080E86DD|nr:Rieske 2Fe-2S domain-containing protein [Aliivibrio fischeri]OCH38078.1 hypothetical protein A6E02_18145 [Aliivibrio fischeri]